MSIDEWGGRRTLRASSFMRWLVLMPCSDSFTSRPPQVSLARRPPSQANRRSCTADTRLRQQQTICRVQPQEGPIKNVLPQEYGVPQPPSQSAVPCPCHPERQCSAAQGLSLSRGQACLMSMVCGSC